ncbi:MAG TPA: ABC transporter permease [Chloroflexota bacterium]|jgi:molybdate transport system permease protein
MIAPARHVQSPNSTFVTEAAVAAKGEYATRPRTRSGSGFASSLGSGAVATTSGLFLLFLTLPLAALLWRSWSGGDFWASVRQPIVLQALLLTVITTALTVLLSIILGTPLAFVLARRSFPGKHAIEAAATLPLVLPPLVAGVALLITFGRRGLLGAQLGALGVEVPFTTAAVVMAQLFVAGPYYLRAARLGFAAIPRDLEEAALMDGAAGWQSFRHVTLPLALPGVVSGMVLCAARAFSEFGATLMFAGNIGGRTQTMSLAIETAIQTDLGSALALSVVLVVIAAVALAIPLLLVRGSEVQ